MASLKFENKDIFKHEYSYILLKFIPENQSFGETAEKVPGCIE